MNMAASTDEMRLIDAAADRAVALAKKAGVKYRKLDAAMDLTAAHLNGSKLDLLKLVAADDFNFGHDVFGIRRHLDRSTGKLGGCFVPRFSAP